MITPPILSWACVALAIALAISLARSHSLSLERDIERNAKVILASNLATSNASLDECLQGMSEVIADGAARDDRVAQHAVRQLEEARMLREQAQSILDSGPTQNCRTSAGAMGNNNL